MVLPHNYRFGERIKLASGNILMVGNRADQNTFEVISQLHVTTLIIKCWLNSNSHSFVRNNKKYAHASSFVGSELISNYHIYTYILPVLLSLSDGHQVKDSEVERQQVRCPLVWFQMGIHLSLRARKQKCCLSCESQFGVTTSSMARINQN